MRTRRPIGFAYWHALWAEVACFVVGHKWEETRAPTTACLRCRIAVSTDWLRGLHR